VYCTTGATTIRRVGSEWGSSDAEPLPDSLIEGGRVRHPQNREERGLIKKLIVCVPAGPAAEADFLGAEGTITTAFEVFQTKGDDQIAMWDVAGRLGQIRIVETEASRIWHRLLPA
jgi:hypothetical protein